MPLVRITMRTRIALSTDSRLLLGRSASHEDDWEREDSAEHGYSNSPQFDGVLGEGDFEPAPGKRAILDLGAAGIEHAGAAGVDPPAPGAAVGAGAADEVGRQTVDRGIAWHGRARAFDLGFVITGGKGPAIAATDYMRSFADQVRPYINDRKFAVLGTDGFGRSDTRKQLRKFFEVNRYYVVIAALKAAANEGLVPMKTVSDAIKKYAIDPEKPAPWTV